MSQRPADCDDVVNHGVSDEAERAGKRGGRTSRYRTRGRARNRQPTPVLGGRVVAQYALTVSLGGAAQSRIRVLRIFHAGRNPAHRARDRALLAAGVEVVYVVPRIWLEAGGEGALSAESFPIIEIDVRSPGDVNRHSYVDVGAVAAGG